MSPGDADSGEETSVWRARLANKRKCPNCNCELNDPAQKADPDKLFLFGFLFVVIGVAACLEYSEGYASHIFAVQIMLGVGVIGWGVFRYQEMRKRHRRRRKHRSTPRLSEVMASQGASAVVLSPAQPNGNSNPAASDSPPAPAPAPHPTQE